MGGSEGRRGGGVGKEDSSTSTGTGRRLHLLPLLVKQNMNSDSACAEKENN